jgi:hypothetical protein
MRDKLIEILRKPIFPHELADPIEAVADYLLANGVIILPCKLGQKIYAVGNKLDAWQIKECKADEFVIDKQRSQVLVHFECDNDCEGCPFNSWAQEFSGEWSCDGEYGQSMIDFDDIGKTVFLSREAAEAALEEERK